MDEEVCILELKPPIWAKDISQIVRALSAIHRLKVVCRQEGSVLRFYTRKRRNPKIHPATGKRLKFSYFLDVEDESKPVEQRRKRRRKSSRPN